LVDLFEKTVNGKEIRIATASELLTLDEEYDNQRSWRADPEKLTFIICKLSDRDEVPSTQDQEIVTAEKHYLPETMIGDINLFLTDYLGDSYDASQSNPHHSQATPPDRLLGEINIMIAIKSWRREGLGRSALGGFLRYVWAHRVEVVKELEDSKKAKYELVGFQAKIDANNMASIGLFKSMGFKETSEGPNFFGEVELLLWPDNGLLQDWNESQIVEYKSVSD
jgi:RimJ/RimL family protein N-acetyltransferase